MKTTLLAAAFAALTLTAGSACAAIVDLESPSLGVAMYAEDWRPTNSFLSAGAAFNNVYNSMFSSWGGFALSRATDTTTPGFMNQYSAWTGSGFGGSSQYAVGYVEPFTPTTPTITLPEGQVPLSLEITNTTYAALVMRDGDAMFGVEKFGGASGNDPDWLKLIITGVDEGNAPTGIVELYLADYRFSNNAQDYILNTWTNVDVSALPWSTRKLMFEIQSSDVGEFGINTPTYFAVDQIVTSVPEPAAGALVLLGALAASRRRRVR